MRRRTRKVPILLRGALRAVKRGRAILIGERVTEWRAVDEPTGRPLVHRRGGRPVVLNVRELVFAVLKRGGTLGGFYYLALWRGEVLADDDCSALDELYRRRWGRATATVLKFMRPEAGDRIYWGDWCVSDVSEVHHAA